MTGPWHVASGQLVDYLADRVDQPTASSIEAHLISCQECRQALATRFESSTVDDSWGSIERAIDDEPRTRVQRVANRAGVSDRTLRTLAPTRSLQVAWLVATSLALLGAAAIVRRAGGPDDGLARLAFLTIAPLAPLAAVVVALSAASEPAPEIARVSPASRLRIGAMRATTVMVAAIAIGLAASAVLPGGWIDAVVWLLPSLALSGLGALAAGRVAPGTAIAWLSSAWVVTVTVTARLTDDRLAAFRPPAQGLYIALALVAAAVITLRPDSLELRSHP